MSAEAFAAAAGWVDKAGEDRSISAEAVDARLASWGTENELPPPTAPRADDQLATDRLRSLLDEGRDSGSDGKTADEHIAELRALLEERRAGPFVSNEEGRRPTREMIARKPRERGLDDGDAD